MSNKKQTAMQELLKEVILERHKSISVEFREALDFVITAIETDYEEMEKQQIIDAWYIGIEKEGEEHGHTFLWHRKDLAEQYYNETFKQL